MKSLKSKRIFVLIWVMLALSVLASIYVVFPSIKYSSKSHSYLWVMLIRLVNTCILIIISFKLWKIVKAYTDKNKWQPHFYQKLRQIGYWAIALTLLSPAIEIAMNVSSYQFIPHIGTQGFVIYITFQFFMLILIKSTAMWVLSLSIFLFAELLQIANQIKTENESII